MQACRQQHPLAVGYWHGLPDDVGLAGSWQRSLLKRWNFEAFGILKSAGKKETLFGDIFSGVTVMEIASSAHKS